MTAQPSKATRKEIEEKSRATTRTKAITLFRDGYDLHKICDPSTGQIRRGFYFLISPEGHCHIVDVVAGTCSASDLDPNRQCAFSFLPENPECKHTIATMNLVLCRVAEGMSEEFLDEFFDPSLLPSLETDPDMDTTTDTAAVEAEVRERRSAAAIPPPSGQDLYGRCPICDQMIIPSEGCFRDHGELSRNPVPKISQKTREMEWA